MLAADLYLGAELRKKTIQNPLLLFLVCNYVIFWIFGFRISSPDPGFLNNKWTLSIIFNNI